MKLTLDMIAKDAAEKALDEITYEGKTIREWVEIIAKQQPCEDCISRQAVLDKKELVELEDGQSFYCINPEDVETLLPVTPQPCEDCVSREEAIRIAEQGQIQGYEWQFKKLCTLPSATPSYNSIKTELKPSEDCINRELVIEWLKDKDIIKTKNQEENARRELNALPSVTPKPKIGHWIDTGSGQICSKCGEIQYGYDNFRRFCASCGAKMAESEDENDNK